SDVPIVVLTLSPKAGAREAIRKLIGSGVQVRIVTGDSDLVTRHLCGLLELPVERVLLGHEIDKMSAAALRAAAADATLFCRVNPQQKQRVVQALRAAGHVVGYLGDGINDAPPLHAADVGLTVDQATEVAREVASLVMLERDLGVVHDAVIEGRRTNANVMKYVLMGTSSNFGNMISMAGASVFLSFLPMLPTQILLNNILYDLSEAALPLDRVDEADLARPLGLDLPLIQRFMATMGLLSSAFDALTFWVLLQVLHAGEAMFRTAWFVESLVTQVLVVFVIRTRHRITEGGRPAPVLIAAALGVVATAVALPYSPLGPMFGLQPLPPAWLGWIAGLTAGYLTIAEFAKRTFYRRFALTRRTAP
ncbi:MAG TPA: HAD-IC family P-type ATPase, partial [Burkholderiaceae bacterium]|nr:HAD-IC family P-type ATPase [Burkholderiaceae bacterium]